MRSFRQPYLDEFDENHYQILYALITISSVPHDPYLVKYLSICETSDLVFQFNLKICKLSISKSVSGVAYFLLTTVYLLMNSDIS